MPNTVWSELYAGRSDWAIRAYRDFVAAMHPWLRGDLERQDHVTLVVYGPTQVGKTTLILTTLGIFPQALKSVSDVLRGGQRAGNSATVLATRYGRSKDDNWRIGDSEGLSADEMRQALAAIRATMEHGEEVQSDVVHVQIPRDLFSDSDNGLDVSIIDLPGTHAAKTNEIVHVRRLAQMYVPTADLVLLVTRVDGLGALHPAALELECLKDWTAQPAKFRVVLTHTFSAASIQDWSRRNPGVLSAESLRDKLYGELSTHELPLPKAGARCLFPVEFGDSWTGLSQVHSPYVETASAVSTALMAELAESLKRASNPFRRLAAAFDLNALVERKRERVKSEHSVVMAALAAAVEEAAEGLMAGQKSLKRARSSRERAVKLEDYLASRPCVVEMEQAISEVFNVKVRPAEAKTVASMRLAASEHVNELLLRWEALRFPDHQDDQDSGQVAPESFRFRRLMASRLGSPPRVEEAYADFVETLRGYVFADYYSWMVGSSYEDDCATLYACGKKAQSIAERETRKSLKTALAAEKKKAAKATRVATNAVSKHEENVERYERELAALNAKKAEHEKHHMSVCIAMKDSIERSVAFRQRMTEGYNQRDEALAEQVREETSPSKRFLIMAIRDLHQREYPQVLEGHLQ